VTLTQTTGDIFSVPVNRPNLHMASTIGTSVSWEGNHRSGIAWPCVTDNSGIATYGLMALGREMSTPPKLQ